jgi:hypothetical protein
MSGTFARQEEGNARKIEQKRTRDSTDRVDIELMESRGMIDTLHRTYPASNGDSLSDHRVDEPTEKKTSTGSISAKRYERRTKRTATGLTSAQLQQS